MISLTDLMARVEKSHNLKNFKLVVNFANAGDLMVGFESHTIWISLSWFEILLTPELYKSRGRKPYKLKHFELVVNSTDTWTLIVGVKSYTGWRALNQLNFLLLLKL